MENVESKVDSKFRFVLLSAQRAEQMIRGARPKVETKGQKPTRIAMNEIVHDAVQWDYGPAPEVDAETGTESEAEAEAEEEPRAAGVN